MFSETAITKLLDQDVINREIGEKLLSIYVADIEGWWGHVGRLREMLVRKHGKEKGLALTKKSIAFTILLPAFDRSTRIDQEHPENLLFWGVGFQQFDQRDWWEELKKVAAQDQKITENRKEVLALGVIDPIDYQPFTRQAYKWLCGKAEESGVDLTPELKLKFRRLVMVYGGAVISYIFEKHQDVVKKVPNWRSGYFFERAIYDVYELDQILKIKNTEMQRTNNKWIRHI